MYRPAVQWFALLAAGLFCCGALAQGSRGAVLTKTAPGQVSHSLLENIIAASQGAVVYPLTDMVIGNTVLPSGDVTASSSLQGPSPRGNGQTIPVTSTMKVPPRAIGRAIASGIPLLGTAIAIVDIMDALRCQEGFGGGVECDEGVSPSSQEVRATRLPFNVDFFCDQPGCTMTNVVQTPGSSPGGQYNGVPSYIFFYSFTLYRPDGTVHPRSSGGRRSVCEPGAVSTRLTATELFCVMPEACPDVSQAYRPPGADGRCPTGNYGTVPPATLGEKVESWGPRSSFPGAVGSIIESGVPLEIDLPELDGPASVHGERVITTNPDGSTVVRDLDHPTVYSPEGYTWRDVVTERTYPPGAEIPAPGVDPGEAAPPPTTTNAPGGSSGPGSTVDIETCGLPGTPPCKIDEGGTPPPPPPDVFGDPDSSLDPLRAIIDQQPLEVEWSWAFTLPTGCEPFQVPGFEEIFPPLDMCQWQPMIHDLMSLIWIATGIWGALSLVSRTLSGVN